MIAASKAAVYDKRRKEPVWKLLASDNAPVILSILQTQLFEHERILPHSIFHERATRELDELCQRGWNLPQTAQAYIAEWLAAGYLERTFPNDASEEVYELSTAAMQAIHFIESLEKKQSRATESRLSLVIAQLVQLAKQTDKNPEARIHQLEKDRNKIEAEIQQIHKGNIKILSSERALEHLHEIIVLSQELINDFRYVRNNFQQLNRLFREQIIENEGSRGEVLKKLFSGVDMIANSEAGRSFKAFWRLLIDPEQSLLLEEATEQILTRPFAKDLQRQDRRFLLGLTRALLDQGGQVHEVLQFFAKSLKHFVQSRVYREQQRLIRLLREAQRQSLSLKDHVHPTDIIVDKFYLSSSRPHSVSQMVLFDPSLAFTTNRMQRVNTFDISLERISEWVMQSEINFPLIKNHIYHLLKIHKQISIADILKIFPAEQGLGSIVGYVALGSRYGTISSQQIENIHWNGLDGVLRFASVPCIYFTEETRDEFAP